MANTPKPLDGRELAELIIQRVSVAKRTLPSTYCKYCKKDPCERLSWSHPLEEFD